MGAACRSMLAPLADRRFRPLLAFGCWFSFCNGLAQAPQYLFQQRVLELSLTSLLVMGIAMRLGQSAVSPTLGRVADRGFSVPMMMASQTIVAASTLFFYIATPASPWWFAGAYLAWIAYAGLNVGLPRLMLNLSPDADSSRHVAAFFAVSGLVFAAGSLLGGHLFERLAVAPSWMTRIVGVEDRYDLFFLGTAALRLLGIAWIARIAEPREG
jgi:predicted MFS family arabinose efflux permease